MRRLTKEFEFGLGHTECYEACSMCFTVECGSFCTGLQEMLKKLAHYEDLEEQGYKVVNINKVVKQLEDASYCIEDGDGHAGHLVFTDEAIEIVKGGVE